MILFLAASLAFIPATATATATMPGYVREISSHREVAVCVCCLPPRTRVIRDTNSAGFVWEVYPDPPEYIRVGIHVRLSES